MQIVCPSGLVVHARKLKGREIKTLITATEKRSAPGSIAQVLSATWESTEDPGPYKFGSGAIDWRQVASGDVLAALIAHGIELNGPEYDFPGRCEKCGHRNDGLVVMLDELRRQPFPETSLARLRENRPLEGKLLDGRTFTFGIDTLEREEYLLKQLEQMKRRPEWADHKPTWMDQLAARIRTIEGFDGSNQFVKRLEFVLDLDGDVLNDLRAKVAAADCGIDTGVEFTCEECRWKQEADFPLGAAFFSPPLKKTPREMTETSEASETSGSETSPS